MLVSTTIGSSLVNPHKLCPVKVITGDVKSADNRDCFPRYGMKSSQQRQLTSDEEISGRFRKPIEQPVQSCERIELTQFRLHENGP